MAVNRDATILYIGWDGQPHNYIARLLRYVRWRSLGNRDRHVRISHDEWCAFFKGRACNCDPGIRKMLPWEIIGS